MGAKFYTADGNLQDVEIAATIYTDADKANLSVEAFINRQYGEKVDSAKHGTPFQQMLASCGLVVPDHNARRHLGQRAPTMDAVLSGMAGFDIAGNSQSFGTPQGQSSRTLFPAALVAYIETALVKDYSMDAVQFDQMVGMEMSVDKDRFEQPQIDMSTSPGGSSQTPNAALAQRRAQLAGPQAFMQFTTSDKTRKIPTYALGMEFSKEALKATTLDLVGMSVKRQLAVERDAWVNSYISDFYAGDLDINTGSLASLGFTVNSSTLDAGATTQVTQRAWLKWLNRLRKYRVIDWVMCDLDTYLKHIEGRTGRPSLTAIDTLLPRMEAHGRVVNNVIGDVKVFIVDDQSAGGPLPTGTILGLDSRYAIARVRNTSANVTAAEQYALRQVEAFSVQFGEICYRMHDNAFDTLVVA
jgi:hypothetical protein